MIIASWARNSMINSISSLLLISSIASFFFGISNAPCAGHSNDIVTILNHEISKAYPGSVVRITGPMRWLSGSGQQDVGNISILGDDGRGNVHFATRNLRGQVNSEGWASFSAWAPVKVAVRRIHPGESLQDEMFVNQTVEVSSGMAHEFRGVLMPQEMGVAGLEASQSILEGQFLTSAAVRRIPDVRRGDLVQIHLISPGLVLSTTGIAEEPGYIQKRVKVMTGKTKKELTGLLQVGGIVEVAL